MGKPKFLLINISGEFMGVARLLQKEGYETFSWYSKELTEGKGIAGKGMIPLVDDLFDVINKFKEHKNELIILIDDNSWGDTCDYLKYEGWAIIGSSHFGDKAEHDREFGMRLAKEIGLEIPPYEMFKNFSEARAFLKNFQKKYPDSKFVFKADGAELAGGSKTYVSESIDDLLWFMDWVEEDQEVHHYTVEKFFLSLKIDGVEADFSAWFNGDSFINNVNLTFEEKKVHGLGAAQGSLGQIISFEPATKSKFFRDYLYKLSPLLKKQGELNEWAANTIIAEKNNKPYFLEWTPRFGWDSTYGEFALLSQTGRSVGEFLERLVKKETFPGGFFPTNKFSSAVKVYSETIGTEGKDVQGKPVRWEPNVDINVFPRAIRKIEDGQMVLTDNPLAVVTAVADTIEDATKECYRIIDPKNQLFSTPDVFYSDSIGKRASKCFEKVRSSGWF